ncbi:hypothetical protein FJ976_22625 [Mesorhizobium sp. B1-1-9]|nr:hypothetical protein FJ978_30750 [Mesorhizobium sp. B1-1-7]TPN46352.1 hypothetical protein FJ976_22625 [Mesorhizobium sp. B1-1-9]
MLPALRLQIVEVCARHPPLPCRASPPQGGRLSARPLAPISIVAGMSGALNLPISPLAGEMAGRPEGGALEPGWASILLSTDLVESQFDESLPAVYSTNTFTLAARPAASITVSVE